MCHRLCTNLMGHGCLLNFVVNKRERRKQRFPHDVICHLFKIKVILVVTFHFIFIDLCSMDEFFVFFLFIIGLNGQYLRSLNHRVIDV